MKPREERLQAILELVAVRPEGGIESNRVIGRIAADYRVSAGTVRHDVEDLVLRGWIVWRTGHLAITRSGRLQLPAPLGAGRTVKTLDSKEE